MKRMGLAVLTLLVAGCGGGGGGGGSETFRVTYNLAQVRTYIPVWEVGATVQVTATVSPLPATTTYVYILDSGSVLVPGSVSIVSNGNGSFTANLPVRGDLTAAEYTGTFTLKLCKDAACASTYPLQGAALPYTITITPEVTTTATADILVDGVTQAGTGGTTDANGVRNYAVSMATGSVVEVDTSIPIVEWSVDPGLSGPTFTFTTVAASTLGVRLALSNPADTSETATISELAADGEMFYVHVTVTH